MTDQDRMKVILQLLTAEIEKYLPEIERMNKKGDGSIDSMCDRSDLLHVLKAFHEIVNIEKFFGLTEAQRIIKGSKLMGKIPVSVKKALGYEGCFE